jgi:large subunit ribosomal protein L21
MYAVVKTGGKQLKVEEGSEAVIEKLDAEVGSTVDFDVLYFTDGKKTVADPEALKGATVTAEVVEHFRGEKVIVFKFKRRKGYKRTKGHRQPYTRVRVKTIGAPKAPAKKAPAKKETGEDAAPAAKKPAAKKPAAKKPAAKKPAAKKEETAEE